MCHCAVAIWLKVLLFCPGGRFCRCAWPHALLRAHGFAASLPPARRDQQPGQLLVVLHLLPTLRLAGRAAGAPSPLFDRSQGHMGEPAQASAQQRRGLGASRASRSVVQRTAVRTLLDPPRRLAVPMERRTVDPPRGPRQGRPGSWAQPCREQQDVRAAMAPRCFVPAEGCRLCACAAAGEGRSCRSRASGRPTEGEGHGRPTVAVRALPPDPDLCVVGIQAV